jgi:anion-transporting  ArsA/GET3 family ATPase
MSDFTSLMAAHRLLVCVGNGGVGKTTTAAALALWGVLHGRRTAVVTIDPSKRLADCLGLSLAEVGETTVAPETFARYGLAPSGTLTALLVDQQSAWDAAVARYAPTPEIRDRIFANRFYRGLSQTFAGSHEYMALDTLATLAQSEVYDLIVLDTPPVQQAWDFLEASKRLQRFLDNRMSKLLLRPSVEHGWAALSFVNRTTGLLLKKVEEATGIAALGEIAEFFSTMHDMFEDFGPRFNRVNALLAGEETAFILVTSPEEEVLKEAEAFHAGLERLTIGLKGIIINRVHTQKGEVDPKELNIKNLTRRVRQMVGRSIQEADGRWLAENFIAHQSLALIEQQRIQKFLLQVPASVPVIQVPFLPGSLADLGGLASLHCYLFSREHKTFL